MIWSFRERLAIGLIVLMALSAGFTIRPLLLGRKPCPATAITGSLERPTQALLDVCVRELSHTIDTYSRALRTMEAQDKSLESTTQSLVQCAGGRR